MKIAIKDIKITKSRRERDEKTIDELAKSLNTVGLLNPITLDYGYELIAGMHRLAAARKLGWTEIECTLADYNELKAKIAELDENLIRNEGNDIERGEWLAQRKEIYEMLHPETKKGMSGGWHNNKSQKLETDNLSVSSEENQTDNLSVCSENKSFIKDVAEKMGVSERSARRKVQIGRDLAPEAKKFAKENGMTKTNAIKLSRMPEEKQKAIVTPIDNFVKTLPEEERKEESKRLLDKELNNSDDPQTKQSEKERKICALFSDAISKSCGMNVTEENLEIYYNELLITISVNNGISIYDSIKTIEYSIENLSIIKNYLEKRNKEVR